MDPKLELDENWPAFTELPDNGVAWLDVVPNDDPNPIPIDENDESRFPSILFVSNPASDNKLIDIKEHDTNLFGFPIMID